jgi:outer membrane immunogenic protein
MRRFALSLAPLALLIAASGAEADDGYRTNPGPNGPDFSGVELGPDVGYAVGSAGPASISGPAGGAHIGYNFQSSQLVGGVEADAMFGAIRSGSLGTASFNQDFLSSARVKGGYVFGNVLAYGTVGWAWSTTNYQDLGVSSGATVKGLAYGLGAEFAITRNVSLRAELLRYDFGDASYATPFASQMLTTTTDVLRIGANLHF